MTKFNEPSNQLHLLNILVSVLIVVSLAVGGLVLSVALAVSKIEASIWTSEQQSEFMEEKFLPLKFKVEYHHPKSGDE